MFALVIHFPAGRYHATPWGRHVNEGDVAWPPEPYRILRALIATWHRAADRDRYDEAALERLINTLATEPPRFRLPEVVHAHTRHYMPTPAGPKLVLDAFLRVVSDDGLVASWQEVTLDPELFSLASHLAERMSYFGRAESIVIVRSENDLGSDLRANCSLGASAPGLYAVETLVPLPAAAYAAERPRLLALNTDIPRSKKRLALEATLPPSLIEALQVETTALQAVGWSHPPAGRFVTYRRPEIGPRPPVGRRRRSTANVSVPKPTVARLVLAGRPPPRIEDAVKIGEAFRLAVMSRIKGDIPFEISGRDAVGKPASDPAHGHAFFLPEDANEDGLIDHLVLYARDGLSGVTRNALGNLRQLWIADRSRVDPEDDPEAGRKEWRLALEGFGEPADFNDCRLLRCSKRWQSVTPYLRPWHTKTSDLPAETIGMVREECHRRGLGLSDVDFDGNDGRSIEVRDGARRNVLQFHRFRSRRGLVQPDRSGAALVLTFEKSISGPVALGFGCHYGLGLFTSKEGFASSGSQ
jgi:CRISPR-associated protein Csb2